LPELIDLYECHRTDRSKFEILAFHDKTVKSFAELDPNLQKLKATYWQNKDLPFPILLDHTGKTEATYGIRAHPTGLLIDPEGKLIGEASPSDLEAKLAPLPASSKWARHRDMYKNVYWRFESPGHTLKQFAEIVAKWTHCPVELDREAAGACGLKPDEPLPGLLIGMPVTLRSVEEILLAPYGLGMSAAPDEKKLLITRVSRAGEPESYFQRLHNKSLSDQLGQRGDAVYLENIHKAAGLGDRPPAIVKSWTIRNQPLIDVINRLVQEADIPVAMDAKALRYKRVDLNALVNGSLFGPEPLGRALKSILAPLDLTFEVAHEVVLITPKSRATDP
jgi:hypothetical protein